MKIRVSGLLTVLLSGTAAFVLLEAIRGGGATAAWEAIWPWLVVLTAAAIHEGGHLLFACAAGVRVRGMRLDLFGARVELSGLLSYGQELTVAAGGPLAGLLSAALGYPLGVLTGLWDSRWLPLFCGASLVLGLVNLLPVGTLDGGRMLYCTLARWGSERLAEGVLTLTATLSLLALWLIAAYALLRAGQMLSVFAFSLCLLLRGREAP